MNKIKESGHTETYTYILLFEAAKLELDEAKEHPDHDFYHALMCIVASAFGLEAYLNHVGPELVPSWKDIERASPREKLDCVCARVGLKPDFGASPYQSFAVAFGIRNLAAHAATDVKEFERMTNDDSGVPEKEVSTLEQQCTRERAKRIFGDAQEMVLQIHRGSGEPFDPFLFASQTSWTRTFE